MTNEHLHYIHFLISFCGATAIGCLTGRFVSRNYRIMPWLDAVGPLLALAGGALWIMIFNFIWTI